MRKLALLILLAIISCKEENKAPSPELIKGIDLKRGEVIVCGPADKQFGSVALAVSGVGNAQKEFDLAMALLHSFEYDESEKIFAKVIDAAPACAMAYWGVAMSNYHPLWAPPAADELKKGAKAINIAQSVPGKTKEESAYINALASFYTGWEKDDHRTRSIRYEKAMEKVFNDFPGDKEAAIFYALALVATADPADKTFAQQRKAGEILNRLYGGQSNHPGIVHYIIHAYDNPVLAPLALTAAREYASIAPSSAHALHMPSHIFTRLGLWTECISSNLASVSSAQCYAQTAGIKGHWDEELHGLDYLMYAYLQKAENGLAKKQLDYLATITEIHPANFKVAYAFASMPSRYMLENKLWKEAAVLKVHRANFSWQDFPWQKAIIHFTRALGNAHNGQTAAARVELNQLKQLQDSLLKQKDTYKANQVDIQLKSAEAWVLFKEGKDEAALQLMRTAADIEDKTAKHSVTPGEVLPARELLADMLLEMNKPAEALIAYEATMSNQPNRFNSLYGAALAAEKLNEPGKAGNFYKQLTDMAGSPGAQRPELDRARAFLKDHKL